MEPVAQAEIAPSKSVSFTPGSLQRSQALVVGIIQELKDAISEAALRASAASRFVSC